MSSVKAKVSDEITAQVTGLATGGACAATITEPEPLRGKKAFISGTIPGELVTARVTFAKKSFVQAEPISIVTPSSDRIAARCPVFDRCGGCDLQHINLSAQRSLKAKMVEDLLRVHGDITVAEGVSILAPDLPGFEYRRRMSFHINKKGEFGLYRKHGRQIVEIDHCPISTPTINTFIGENLALIKECAPEIETVTVEDHDGTVFLALEVHPRNDTALTTLAPKSAFQELCRRYPNTQVNFRHKPIFRATERAADAPPVGHFSQNNKLANDAMIACIIENVTSTEVTDLYAGAGNISIPLALAGKRVTAVELDPHLVAFGRWRAKEAGVEDRLVFHQQGCEKWIESGSPDVTVVLDPPRSGAFEVCQRLDPARSPRLVYVSCYPPTFARDVQVLHERGYILESLKVLDMFPQTYHSELVGILVAR